MTLPQEPTAVLPHRSNALLLESMLEADDARATASLVVRPDTAFSAPDGCLPGWIGIEVMAEAVAGWAGCRSLRQAGRAAEIGLLLGVREYRATLESFPVGLRLVVEVVCSSMDSDGRGVFDCRILSGGTCVAAAILTVYQPVDDSFIQAERARDD